MVSTGKESALRGHLAICRHVFGCHSWGAWGRHGLWGGVRDVAKHATMDRTAPDDKIYIYPTPRVNGAKVERPVVAKLSSPAQACLFPLARSQRGKKLFVSAQSSLVLGIYRSLPTNRDISTSLLESSCLLGRFSQPDVRKTPPSFVSWPPKWLPFPRGCCHT